MLVLALDTATPMLVAGVARWSRDAAEVLAEETRPSGTRHAELLAPAVRAALSAAGVGMGDLDAVVVGLGPGPFTGLRVGVVTAAALADVRGLPAVGVCSLDAVGSGTRTVVTDARRREVYWARYDEDDRVGGPGVARPEELTAPGPYVGDPRFAERLGTDVAAADVTTAGLLRAAADPLAGPAAGAAPLVPLYLRRPDAVPPGASKAVTRT